MKRTILLILLLLTNLACVFAQVNRDFSFNMVKMTDGTSDKAAPEYGFITSTDKSNEKFYFVMIYPESTPPLQSMNIIYKTAELEGEELRTARASLIPYDGIVLIGGRRIVVYQATGRTSIQRQYVRDPSTLNRATHRIYINRQTGKGPYQPDIFDIFAEMNTRQYDKEANQLLSFRFLGDIPDIIAAGYPVVDRDGYLTGLIAAPTGNENFDVIRVSILNRKLSAMSDDGNACKYFGLFYPGAIGTECEDGFKKDSIEEARKENWRRHVRAVKENKNYPVTVSLKAGASGQYINVAGTVSPGFGYYGGLNLHLLPDTGIFSLSVRPKYGIYRYNPMYYAGIQAETQTSFEEYAITRAENKQFDLQFMAELRLGRKLNGQTYIGLGYSRGFPGESSFRLTKTGSSTTRYTMPKNSGALHNFVLEFGWDVGRIRYALSTTYQRVSPFPRDYSITVDDVVFTPFADINPHNFYLNFEIAFRLWGHWRNGVKG